MDLFAKTFLAVVVPLHYQGPSGSTAGVPAAVPLQPAVVPLAGGSTAGVPAVVPLELGQRVGVTV